MNIIKKSEKYIKIEYCHVVQVEKTIDDLINEYKAWYDEYNNEYNDSDPYEPHFIRYYIKDSDDVIYDPNETGHDCSNYLLVETGELNTILDEHGIPYEFVQGIDRKTLKRNPFVLGDDQFYVISGSFADLHVVGDII